MSGLNGIACREGGRDRAPSRESGRQPSVVQLGDSFDIEACDRCGDCLAKCPVIRLSQDDSRREIGRLIDGEECRSVLEHCATCLLYLCVARKLYPLASPVHHIRDLM